MIDPQRIQELQRVNQQLRDLTQALSTFEGNRKRHTYRTEEWRQLVERWRETIVAWRNYVTAVIQWLDGRLDVIEAQLGIVPPPPPPPPAQFNP